MAISLDAVAVANSGATGVASLTWSHTASGTDRILIVGISWTGTSTTMSVTHAGNAPTGSLTQSDATTAYHSRIYYWVAPTTGAQNIVATPSATASIYGGSVSFAGVDQSTPCPTETGATGSGFGSVSTSITVANANAWVFSLIGMANATSTLTATRTQAFNEGNTTIARRSAGQYTGALSTGSNAIAWTISGTTNRSWAHRLVELKPSGGTPPPANTTNFFQFF